MELGVLNINSHYIGSNSVSKIYKGTELVFEKVEFELIPFFEDNFNSGSLDTNNWYIDLGNGLSGWGNGQLEYASRKADNIKVEDNQLKLTAIKEDYRGFQYTSGRLRSKNWFLYGRIEVRAKLPGTGGMWPAIFLFGKDYTYTDYSVWPQCGEIDIIEVNGNSPNIAHTSVHTSYYNYNTGRPKHKQTTISGLTTQFRNYRIDWTPDYIRWFIDDVQVYEFLNDHIDTARWPFDSPVFLLMYLGVGGSFVGPVNDTALPQTMEVEYVKYYRMSDHLVIPQPTIPIPNPTPEHQVVNSGENLQVSCSAIPSHTIRWYINQVQVGTGTTLSIPNTGGLSPGNISVECVAVDGSNNIGTSATVTAQVSTFLPIPTSAQQSYTTTVGGTITITLTNRPAGADTQWYAGGPEGTGQLLYEGGWVLQIGPPNTNAPASMDLYIRYKQGTSYSDYYIVNVTITEPEPQNWIMGINLTGTTGTQAPANWNNLHYENNTPYNNLKSTDNIDRGVSLISRTGLPDFSTGTGIAATLPVYEIYQDDWWGYVSGQPIILSFNGFDDEKKYKVKVLNNWEGSSCKFSLVNDEATAVSQVGYPTSSDLLDDAGYVVLEGKSTDGVINIFGFNDGLNETTYTQVLAVIIIEYDEDGPEPEEGLKALTIEVIGAPDVDIIYNNEIQPNNTLLFPKDTEVNNITPSAVGYSFSPTSQSVVMDSDKTITFTATEE